MGEYLKPEREDFKWRSTGGSGHPSNRCYRWGPSKGNRAPPMSSDWDPRLGKGDPSSRRGRLSRLRRPPAMPARPPDRSLSVARSLDPFLLCPSPVLAESALGLRVARGESPAARTASTGARSPARDICKYPPKLDLNRIAVINRDQNLCK
jgi:hypothetical protein